MVRGQWDVEKRWERHEYVYMLNKKSGRIMEGEEREWNFERIER